MIDQTSSIDMKLLTNVWRGHRKIVLFTAAAALRILLVVFFPAVPDLLTGRVEISTPVNSFKRLQEGLFLYEHGLDPYDGGIFHQAPLLLPIFSMLPSSETWFGRLATACLYTALDLLSADSLYEIAESGAASVSRVYTSPRTLRAWEPISVAAIYLLNPFTLIACLGRPTTLFSSTFVLLSVSYACRARMGTSIFALSIASYISLHPAFLLPSIGLLCYDRLCKQAYQPVSVTIDGKVAIDVPASKVAVDQRTLPKAVPFALQLTFSFTAITAFLLGLSRLLMPSWLFIPSVYTTPLTLPDLTPNPGLWWYFFIEMFDTFRPFFLGVFWLHIFSYSIPFSLRLRKQPLAAVVSMMGIIAIFEPYANAGDVGAWLSSLCLLGHAFELSSLHRYTFPAISALLYTILLGPAFHHLWIYAGSGNANFFYAITLVWNLALLILLADTLYAVLRDEWESERPETKNREVRQI